MLKRLIIVLTLASLVTLLVMGLPDIKRYLQIRRMLLRAGCACCPSRPARAGRTDKTR